MARHVSKHMQYIKRIGSTLHSMDNVVYNGYPTDGLTREAIEEVANATPDDRRESCWHVGLTDKDAAALADTAEHVVDWWRDNMDILDADAE